MIKMINDISIFFLTDLSPEIKTLVRMKRKAPTGGGTEKFTFFSPDKLEDSRYAQCCKHLHAALCHY